MIDHILISPAIGLTMNPNTDIDFNIDHSKLDHSKLDHPKLGRVKLAFVLIPRFNMLSLTSLIEPLRIANYLSPVPIYQWSYLSFDGSPITASNGITVDSDKAHNQQGLQFHTIFVLGSWGSEHYSNNRMFEWLRWCHLHGAPLCSVEMGLYALARAQIIGTRPMTTHWSVMAGFKEQYPKVKLVEQLYTTDPAMMSCAGGTTGADLMLHLISEKHGRQLCSEIMDQMLHYPIRSAGLSQRHTHGSSMTTAHPYVDKAIKLIENNMAEPLRRSRYCAHN